MLPCFFMPGVELVVKNQLTSKDLAGQGIDIVFFNRIITNVSIELVLQLRKDHGFKLVVDFDDHWRLEPDHLLYENYKRLEITKIMEEYIKLADAVTVTHERLYDEAIKLNDNVHILPNAIPQAGQFLVKKEPSDLPRLFWAGGITHKKDMELLRRPMQLIKRNRCKFVLGGFVANNTEWNEMAKIFTTDSNFNTEVWEAMDVNNYYRLYAKCDISVIPLQRTFFNSMKSNLKILEAANVAAPVIVSRVDPYLGFPEHLVNYVDSHNPWVRQINKLLDCPGEAIEQGRLLREYCERTFNFTAINTERKQLFDSICYNKTIQHGKADIRSANTA